MAVAIFRLAGSYLIGKSRGTTDADPHRLDLYSYISSLRCRGTLNVVLAEIDASNIVVSGEITHEFNQKRITKKV